MFGGRCGTAGPRLLLYSITHPTLAVFSASPSDGPEEKEAEMEGDVMVDDDEGDEDEDEEDEGDEVEEDYMENEEVADAGEWSGSSVHGWNLADVA